MIIAGIIGMLIGGTLMAFFKKENNVGLKYEELKPQTILRVEKLINKQTEKLFKEDESSYFTVAEWECENIITKEKINIITADKSFNDATGRYIVTTNIINHII